MTRIGSGAGRVQVSWSHQRRFRRHVQRTVQNHPTSSTDALDALHTLKQVRSFQDTLRSAAAGLTKVASAQPGRVRNVTATGATLGLDNVDRTSTHDPTAEVNTRSTSFSPRGPGWDGPDSTSLVTVGGEYTGALEDTLEFRVAADRTVGGNKKIRLKIYDSSGTYLDRLDFAAFTPADTEMTTSFGLTVSLGAGVVEKNESFFVDVSASTGTAVEVDNPFDGIRNDHAELDDGFSITAGSFDVNGVNIAVSASDSLRDVLDRVNASAAGVVATYDSAADRVLLETSSPSEDAISLANDTSGFLAAMKLAGGTATVGNLADRSQVIDDVSALSGISTGTFSINGTDIAIDTSADSLDDIIGRINAADVGVQATYDAASDSVRLTATTVSGATLDDGTSGLFDALGIEESTLDAPGLRATRLRKGHDARPYYSEVMSAFEGFAQHATLGSGSSSVLAGVQSDLSRTLQQAFGEAFDDMDTESGVLKAFGLRVDPDASADGALLEVDLDAFTRAVNSDAEGAFRFLLGDEESGATGLLGHLSLTLQRLESSLSDRIDGGLLVDLRV